MRVGYTCSCDWELLLEPTPMAIGCTYEPAEDTWLLCSEAACCKLMVDVGCGSGASTTCIASRCKPSYLVGVDVDPCAAEGTLAATRAAGYGHLVDVVQSTTLAWLRSGAGACAAFNTPYLPLEGEELWWSGGCKAALEAMWYSSGCSRLLLLLSTRSCNVEALVVIAASRGFTISLEERRVGLFEELLLLLLERGCA